MSNVTRVLMGFFVLVGTLIMPAMASAATHTVVRGESLYIISQNYGITVDALAQANGIKGTLIEAGQILNIPETGRSYIVKSGDTLYKIGLKLGVDYREIMSANGLKSDYLYPGMNLYIPSSNGGSGEVSGGGQTAQNGQFQSYKVQSGDTLSKIGLKFGVDYQEIMSANSLDSEYLYVGMDLYIPSSNGGSGEVSRGGQVTRATAWEADLLARLITAEADAEPYVGKLAVGAVVLNRTRDSNFPKTIYDVIYQYDSGTYQFEPVMNGWIERSATADSIRAAKAALNGWDPTNGAVYFFATYVTNPWLWSRPLSGIIGNTAFTY